jgi:membrane-associated protein
VTLLGYWLGGIAFLQKNIEAALILIVGVSVLPMAFEWFRHRARAGRAASLGD